MSTSGPKNYTRAVVIAFLLLIFQVTISLALDPGANVDRKANLRKASVVLGHCLSWPLGGIKATEIKRGHSFLQWLKIRRGRHALQFMWPWPVKVGWGWIACIWHKEVTGIFNKYITYHLFASQVWLGRTSLRWCFHLRSKEWRSSRKQHQLENFVWG